MQVSRYKIQHTYTNLITCIGLLVSAITFGSSSLSSTAGWGHFVVFPCLSLSEYIQRKWVPANFMLGDPARDQHPIQW